MNQLNYLNQCYLKRYHYFFNFKLSALKHTYIRAIGVFYENSTVSKIFRSYCPKPLTADAELSSSDYSTWHGYLVANSRPEMQTSSPHCGAHFSQAQLHSLLFLKGRVCVNDWFSTTQVAVESGPRLQAHLSPGQSVEDHIWKARGSPAMVSRRLEETALFWDTAARPSTVPFIGKLNHQVP